MLKEAIEKIVSLAGPKTFTAGEHTYIADDDGDYKEVVPDVYGPVAIALRSLDAVVKMVKTEALKQEPGIVYITVPTHLKVEVFRSPLGDDERYFRPVLYRAEAADVPGWEASVKLPFDQAAVALQTRFQEGGDREYTIDLLSMISTGAKVTYNDTGIATNVVTSKGVVLQENTAIRPVVQLRPYRTFQEVEQPMGRFLIRIDERGITFTEADGGMWKLTARKTVAAWLTEQLQAEVDAGQVVIAL